VNPYFLIGLAAAGLFIWTVGAYSFWRIRRTHQMSSPRKEAEPAFRLAEQWMAQSQTKMEKFVQTAEQPLGAAQNELLELRLEAGRLPQGIKSLKLVRESLEGSFQPTAMSKKLTDLVRVHLDQGDFKLDDPSLVFWKTPLGEMPCLEVEGGGTLTDDRMKAALARMNQALNRNPGTGGFLYFPDPANYQTCLQNPAWVEGLKSLRLMVVDFKGLTALLVSLRLAKDTDRVLQAFQEGVDSTRALVGQSDKMNEALSRLSGDSLKSRTAIEGTIPDRLGDAP
jgi:hypothetical protein